MISLRHMRMILANELRVERSAAEVIGLVLPFALAALVVLPVAIGIDQATISRLAYPAYWTVVVLFGMQIAWRQVSGHSRAVSDQVRLAGVDPASAFLGRFLANLILVTVFAVATFVGVVFFYSPPALARWWLFAAAAVLCWIGLALLATIVADLTVGMSSRGGVAPLLTLPLTVPLVLAAAQVGRAGLAAEPRPASILPWVLILVLIDLIGIVAGVMTARPLEDALG